MPGQGPHHHCSGRDFLIIKKSFDSQSTQYELKEFYNQTEQLTVLKDFIILEQVIEHIFPFICFSLRHYSRTVRIPD